MTVIIDSAHLKTVRELLGLTAQSAAQLAGVSLRTWQNWESSQLDRVVRPEVSALLSERLAHLVGRVAGTLDATNGLSRGGGQTLRLRRYDSEEFLREEHPEFPGGLDEHAALIRALLLALSLEGRAVTVEWAHDDEDEDEGQLFYEDEPED